MRALSSSAASAGVRAVGFLTAELQAALLAGYQFQQQGGDPNAQFRAIFWEVGKPQLLQGRSPVS